MYYCPFEGKRTTGDEGEAMAKHMAFSQIQNFDRIDDRVSIVNMAFANLIGVNAGFIEFCPDENRPSRAELIALAWLVNPTASRPSVEGGANPYFVKLVREWYEHESDGF